jgi:hypothetical protein
MKPWRTSRSRSQDDRPARRRTCPSIELFVARGANIAHPSKRGLTPLIMATPQSPRRDLAGGGHDTDYYDFASTLDVLARHGITALGAAVLAIADRNRNFRAIETIVPRETIQFEYPPAESQR